MRRGADEDPASGRSPSGSGRYCWEGGGGRQGCMKVQSASEDDKILESFIPMVDFYAETLGRNCEVILHDLRQLESSIIAIRNGHVSGRRVGGCITGFALELLEKKVYERKNYIANYVGKTDETQKTVRASTFFIKNLANNVIGMLCVNVDITAFLAARSAIDEFVSMANVASDDDPILPEENLDLDPKALISSRFDRVLSKVGIEPERMTPTEKSAVVFELAELGVFRIKGAVSEISALLRVSEPTIYRYLKRASSR